MPIAHKEFRIRYETALNTSQLEAVTQTTGPLLVIAGAGSGKTRTLTFRAAYLVEKGASPAAILLLTFTRKASQEMLRRATQLLDDRCEKFPAELFIHLRIRHCANMRHISGWTRLLESWIGSIRKI